MRFVKLTLVSDGREISINPREIQYVITDNEYFKDQESTEIRLTGDFLYHVKENRETVLYMLSNTPD